MGYDLHITRKDDWCDKDNDISLEEWLAAVAADPEMRLDGYAEARLPDGRVLRVESAGLAVWTAWSHNGKDGNMAWIDWSRGNVTAKNPDRPFRRKMWRLAQVLKARVQGDDGEFYDDWGDSDSGGTYP
jgi:hypothetical protein